MALRHFLRSGCTGRSTSSKSVATPRLKPPAPANSLSAMICLRRLGEPSKAPLFSPTQSLPQANILRTFNFQLEYANVCPVLILAPIFGLGPPPGARLV